MSNDITQQQIIEYYESCNIDYKLIWNLGKFGAMHFGYWDNKVKNFPQSLERENEILAEKANIKASDVVLDAGCGVGGSSIFLAEKYGCKVIGITLSNKQVIQATKKAARKGVSNNTEFLVMDFENITFPDERFDVIWAIESVCHAINKEKFIEEAFRVLKKGGRLVVADGFATKEKYQETERDIMYKWLSGWGVNFLETKEKFEKYLKVVGFKKISFSDITHQAMPSSRRMYRYSFPAIFFGKVAEFLKIRTKIQTGNIIAARYQNLALKKDLWKYGIFYAEKN